MARMPGASWTGEHGSSPMTRYDIFCVHTIVGYAPAHAAHFSVSGGGTIFQSRSTVFKSAANLNGNHRVIAVETEDKGSAFGTWPCSTCVPKWTDAQLDALVDLGEWVAKTHDIPPVLVPDSKPERRGFAYHRQGIDGNFDSFKYPGRVAGGELWSAHFGKVCPGDARITQFINEIIPRVQARMRPADTDFMVVRRKAGITLRKRFEWYSPNMEDYIKKYARKGWRITIRKVDG